jgi:hypothetical protein
MGDYAGAKELLGGQSQGASPYGRGTDGIAPGATGEHGALWLALYGLWWEAERERPRPLHWVETWSVPAWRQRSQHETFRARLLAQPDRGRTLHGALPYY